MSDIPDDIMKEADKLYFRLQSPWVGGYSRAIEVADKEKIAAFILSERQRTSDLIEEVKMVLRPFAKAATLADERNSTGGSQFNFPEATIEEFRTARALLSKLEANIP